MDDISERKFGGESIPMVDDGFSCLKFGDIKSCGDKEESRAIGQQGNSMVFVHFAHNILQQAAATFMNMLITNSNGNLTII